MDDERLASFGDALDALRHTGRRSVLFALLAQDAETDAPLFLEEFDDAADSTVEMVHVHLPKLAGAGLVDWRPDSRELRRGPNFSEARPLLALLVDNESKLPDGWP